MERFGNKKILTEKMTMPNGQEVSYYTGPLPDFSKLPVNNGSQYLTNQDLNGLFNDRPMPKSVKLKTQQSSENNENMNYMVNSAREFLMTQKEKNIQNEFLNGLGAQKVSQKPKWSSQSYWARHWVKSLSRFLRSS